MEEKAQNEAPKIGSMQTIGKEGGKEIILVAGGAVREYTKAMHIRRCSLRPMARLCWIEKKPSEKQALIACGRAGVFS